MKKIFSFFILFFFLAASLTSFSGAQSLPYVKGVILQPVVTFDPNTEIFTYSYEVTNSPESVGAIYSFMFDLILPKGTVDPGSSGLQNNPTITVPVNVIGTRFFNTKLLGKVVSVAFTSAPSTWRGGYMGASPGIFSSLRPRGVVVPIGPGETMGPFVIQSRGLAGIRNFRFEPNRSHIWDLFPDPESMPTLEKTNEVYRAYSLAMKSVTFLTQGIAPTALPANCDPACMVQFLIKEKEQAFNLGWIDNQGVANSLDAKLNEAKVKLQAGQTKVAANILKSFILDLIAQHIGQTGQGQGQGNPQGKHVNDNAFYLLKPNAEFILYKLGQL